MVPPSNKLDGRGETAVFELHGPGFLIFVSLRFNSACLHFFNYLLFFVKSNKLDGRGETAVFELHRPSFFTFWFSKVQFLMVPFFIFKLLFL